MQLLVTPVLNQGADSFTAADILQVGGHFLVTASNGTHVFLSMSGISSWKLLGVGSYVLGALLNSSAHPYWRIYHEFTIKC